MVDGGEKKEEENCTVERTLCVSVANENRNEKFLPKNVPSKICCSEW
jgi:hypothetical protein